MTKVSKGFCTCGQLLTEDNCAASVFKEGRGYCRKCRNLRMAQWVNNNPEKVATIRLRGYVKNRANRLESKRKYYQIHKEEVSAWHKKHIRTPRGRHDQVKEALRRDGVIPNDALWSLNYYTEIIKDGACHYCLGSLNPSSHALDRMNNDLPHACWNVVPCCWYCNEKKSNDTTYEEMMLLAPALREIRRRREATDVAAPMREMPSTS